MAIMTGRYSNKELRNDGYYPVGISVGKPRFSTGYEIREQCYALAPRYDMLKLGYHDLWKCCTHEIKDGKIHFYMACFDY